MPSMLQPITLYRTASGLVAQRGEDCFFLADLTMDAVFQHADPHSLLEPMLSYGKPVERPAELLSPIQSQEVWASGVTYLRSRDARMEESKDGGNVYDRVYAADRPELFFKATPHRVVAPGAAVRIRADSKWNVPEPEVALAINTAGKIFGYTVGNDMSSRDIEGENLLYLPQAKVYHRSCASGPFIVLGATEAAVRRWTIGVEIRRRRRTVFKGQTSVGNIKRGFDELAGWLCRSQHFPHGALLLTGTGVVPGDEFTLAARDVVRITISGIGVLENTVAVV